MFRLFEGGTFLKDPALRPSSPRMLEPTPIKWIEGKRWFEPIWSKFLGLKPSLPLKLQIGLFRWFKSCCLCSSLNFQLKIFQVGEKNILKRNHFRIPGSLRHLPKVLKYKFNPLKKASTMKTTSTLTTLTPSTTFFVSRCKSAAAAINDDHVLHFFSSHARS